MLHTSLVLYFSQRTHRAYLSKRRCADLKWSVLRNDFFSSERDFVSYEDCVAAQDIVTITVSQICNTHALDANLLDSRPRKSCKGNVML